MFDYQGIYHVGIRVTDIDAAMDDYSRTMNVTWATVQHSDARNVWTPETGERKVALTFVYTKEGPQHIELLQGDLIWDCEGKPGLHHVGVWSHDVAADVDHHLANGWSLTAATLPPEEGYGTMAYVLSPTGSLVELVSIKAKPRFDTWFAGGLMGGER